MSHEEYDLSGMDNSGKPNVPDGLIVDSHPDILNPHSFGEALEDVEHPAWISTTSFSESCGSYLSRISSLCLESKESEFSEADDCRIVPEHSQEASNAEGNFCFEEPGMNFQFEETSDSHKVGHAALIFQEDNNPFTVSGSLQSLSSSSKTIYASPRSTSGRQFFIANNKSLAGRAIQRQGSLYRERAPSENALDFSNLKSVQESKLSQSLHDVSSIPSNGLKKPARRSAGASLSTLCLRNRSRDSGFVQSESLQSLNSGSRNYDHVESKVKRYIQDIKDADAIRRKERARSRTLCASDQKPPLEKDYFECEDISIEGIILKLKQDLYDKDRLISKLQEDYNCLLGKYAEAENKIDKLRFGWHENPSASGHGHSLSPPKKQQKSNNFLLPVQTPTLSEIDNYSLSSSVFNIDEFATPNSSFDGRGGVQNVNLKNKKSKEVVVSAPLRPISRLYCTSVRLDRVMTPLQSRSSVDEHSVAATQDDSNVSNKKKQMIDGGLPETTMLEGTTDTGIDTFCPLSIEGVSTTPHQTDPEPIGHLPHEDLMLKVQRWQKSIPTSNHSHPKFSPPSKSSSRKRNQLPYNSFEMMGQPQNFKFSDHNVNKKNYSSIGIQVNEGDSLDLPSTISRMSTPMVPCLNLEELSGCTDDFSGSLLLSECGRNKSTRHVPSESQPSSKVNFDSHCSGPSKSFSSNIEISTSAKHICEGSCQYCGSSLKSRGKYVISNKRKEERNNQYSSEEKHCSPRNQAPLPSRKHSVEKSISQLSGSELAKLVSIIWKDQDHVVPTSPEEEKSFQHAFKTLEQKMNSLKSSVNLQTFVSLLDILLEKGPSKGCVCRHDHSIPSSRNITMSSYPPVQETSVVPDCSDMDGSLLQCLEEMDQYTHQVWAKTESFLEVLNSDKCNPSIKT
ncbi:Microtubule organization protein AKNA [Frankliniella fusca]|uniref:Microtubule organization protein AKNA n=1 Tax=Frankliniella fusca TaxID=407009 RepID=A0AAE1HCF3_9NEOP|nr:Microtubule organization protein AKNA [Frankliniella fusca]